MNNYIGVGETLLMSSVNGIIFALFAAQPLLIVGATGPLMIFDMSLYSVRGGVLSFRRFMNRIHRLGVIF